MRPEATFYESLNAWQPRFSSGAHGCAGVFQRVSRKVPPYLYRRRGAGLYWNTLEGASEVSTRWREIRYLDQLRYRTKRQRKAGELGGAFGRCWRRHASIVGVLPWRGFRRAVHDLFQPDPLLQLIQNGVCSVALELEVVDHKSPLPRAINVGDFRDALISPSAFVQQLDLIEAKSLAPTGSNPLVVHFNPVAARSQWNRDQIEA